jgi:lipopolysaccharide export system ATP-binding protein
MHLLEIRNLVKSYGGRRVVDDIDLAIKHGEIVGLLGPNGAGKTTTFNMITGLVKAEKGEIFFDQQNVAGIPMHERCRKGIGYLSQDPSIFRKLTVEENIMAVLETLPIPMRERRKRLELLLGELNITYLRKNKAYTLSGGERRRLEITRALVTNPLFVLLDEPFSGIDPIAVFECQQIISDLKTRDIGILLTDHNVRETLAITDRSYIMSDGKILISGTAEELISSPKAREIYLGEKFRM